MASMDKIDLKKSMLMLVGLVGIFGAYLIVKFIILLVVGAVAQVAISGNVAVPALINTTINNTLNSQGTYWAFIDAGVALVLGLIGLVVVISLFWGLIKPYISTGKGSSGGGFN